MKRRGRSLLLLCFDVFAIVSSFVLAFFVRFDGQLLKGIANEYIEGCLANFIVIILIKIVVFYSFKLYNSLWKYASVEEMLQVMIASFFATAAVVTYMVIVGQHLPRTIYFLTCLFDIILIGGIRFNYRTLRWLKGLKYVRRNNGHLKRVMIIGAGKAGAMVIKEMKESYNVKSKPILLIDDDEKKVGKVIYGVPVLGNRNQIKKLVEKHEIDEIIIAIPSAPKNVIKELVNVCSKMKCKLKILPGIYELIDGQVSIKKIREVKIEDLLGREPIKLDLLKVSHYLKDKVVLVTGGGGSIGSELCRQIATFEPKQLMILEIYENNAYDIQNELIRKYPTLNLKVLIASIRDMHRLEEIFSQYRPQVVFHAAAHKHVPLMEEHPQEAIKNNVFGTMNVVKCSDAYTVEKFVLISTDKAVNSTNVMGATKRMAEMIVQAMSRRSQTEFVAVRFGNVLGSNGSVVPLFKKQIESGGPVTVTHPNVTRYFMTIPEAVQLVIQAGAMAEGGEIFVLDMGEPVKIIDLAEKLIRLTGFEPYEEIDIQFVGLRPGEKLYEELLMAEEGLEETRHEKIFIGKPLEIDYESLMYQLSQLKQVLKEDKEQIFQYLDFMIPTYTRKQIC